MTKPIEDHNKIFLRFFASRQPKKCLEYITKLHEQKIPVSAQHLSLFLNTYEACREQKEKLLWRNFEYSANVPTLSSILSYLATNESTYLREKLKDNNLLSKLRHSTFARLNTDELICLFKSYIVFSKEKSQDKFSILVECDIDFSKKIDTMIAFLRTPHPCSSQTYSIFKEFLASNTDAVLSTALVPPRKLISIVETIADYDDKNGCALALSALVTSARFSLAKANFKDKSSTGYSIPNGIYPEAILHFTQRFSSKIPAEFKALYKRALKDVMQIYGDDNLLTQFAEPDQAILSSDRFFVSGVDKQKMKQLPPIWAGNYKNVAIVGDHSINKGHFGCHLVAQTIREKCSQFGMNVILSSPKAYSKESFAEMEKADLIIINGEGSVHHNKGNQLLELAKRFPAALINSVYQENSSPELLDNFLHISVRESFSANEIASSGRYAQIVPDLLFGSSLIRSLKNYPTKAEGLGVTDNVIDTKSGFSPMTQNPAEYILKLKQFQRVVCGRFHAAAACAVLGIPFSTWDSNTWKTEALMHDMNISQYHSSSQQKAIEKVPDILPLSVNSYVDEANSKIDQLFKLLAQL